MSGVSNEKVLRIGLVGLGKIARDQHVPAIAASTAFELVATVDPGAEGLENVPHFADLDAMLGGDVRIDAVAICTPPRLRADLARRALSAGLHVMLEKPPAASVGEARSLLEHAHSERRTLFAAWHSREAAGVDAARAWLSDKAIREVSITWKEDVRVWHPGQDWIFQEGGFGVFDPAINALSIATAILPGEWSVDTARLDIPSNCSAPIAGQVAMTQGGSVPVTLDMDFLQTGPQIWDIAVETDAGRLLLSEGGAVLRLPEDEVRGTDKEYPRLYDRFAELVSAGESDVDCTPLALVESALSIGERREVSAFFE